jgi:phage terminase Nu1 subunit (DNA packaging protein)
MTTRQTRPRGRPRSPDRTIAQAAQDGLTRAELATLCRLPATTIDGWRRRGCPTIGAGRFDLGSVLQWVRIQAAEQAQASRTTEASEKALADWRGARAAREELRLARDRGEVVDRSDVVEFAGRAVLVCRNRLLLLVKKMTARFGPLMGPNGHDIAERELAAEVYAILTAFSKGMNDVPSVNGAATAALAAAPPALPTATTEPTDASDAEGSAAEEQTEPANEAGDQPEEQKT